MEAILWQNYCLTKENVFSLKTLQLSSQHSRASVSSIIIATRPHLLNMVVNHFALSQGSLVILHILIFDTGTTTFLLLRGALRDNYISKFEI